MRRLLARRVLVPVDALIVAVVLAVLVVRLAGAAVPPALQYVPFAVSLVVLGLPHGAVDHLVPARLAARWAGARGVLAVVAVYLVLGSAVLAAWAAAPVAAFAGFVVLTWFHWGQGDLAVAVAERSLDGAGVGRRALLVAARGSIPMLVPFVAHPAAVAAIAVATTRPFSPDTAAAFATLGSPGPRLALAVVVGALVVGERVAALADRGADRRWRADTAETALLVALIAIVPPVLAIGLYFCVWHALRHILRLVLLDPAGAADLSRGALGRATARFAAQAAPLTVAAIALLVALGAVLPRAAGPAGVLGVYLVLISALTVPHVAVVCAMDARQHVWRRCRGIA